MQGNLINWHLGGRERSSMSSTSGITKVNVELTIGMFGINGQGTVYKSCDIIVTNGLAMLGGIVCSSGQHNLGGA